MQRFYHRAGVSVVAWRQSGSVPVAATLAPRDCHRRIVSRGNRIRISVGYTAAGPTSVTADLAASYNLQVFFNAKFQEIIEIFKPADPADKSKLFNTLQIIDPGHIGQYQGMMRGS